MATQTDNSLHSKPEGFKSLSAAPSKRGLAASKHEDGYYHFYWNGHDITGHWMWFFSGLSLKEENYAGWLYAKRHGKELNKAHPYKPNATLSNLEGR